MKSLCFSAKISEILPFLPVDLLNSPCVAAEFCHRPEQIRTATDSRAGRRFTRQRPMDTWKCCDDCCRREGNQALLGSGWDINIHHISQVTSVYYYIVYHYIQVISKPDIFSILRLVYPYVNYITLMAIAW